MLFFHEDFLMAEEMRLSSLALQTRARPYNSTAAPFDQGNELVKRKSAVRSQTAIA